MGAASDDQQINREQADDQLAGELVIAVLLVLANGFCVAVEFSVARLRPTQAQELLRQGKPGAKSVAHAVDRIDAYLSACQLGKAMASLGLGAIGEPVFHDRALPRGRRTAVRRREMPMRALADHLDFEVEGRHETTVGGYLSEHVARVPDAGEVIECQGHQVGILAATETRITKVATVPNDGPGG